MTREEISALVHAQRSFFHTNATLPVEFRINALKKLHQALTDYESRILDALKADLGKCGTEGYMCEVGMTLGEIKWFIKHLRSLAKEKTVPTPLAQFHSRSYQKPCPYGVTLIMSPWNYPILLTLDPLVSALAAGNTAIVKPSAYSPATSAVMAELLSEIYPPEYVAVVTGGREENNYLMEEKFDYIFFTGSKSVGHIVLEKAARHLTPVTLELGGKSPCVVHESANIPLAARRIVFGKYLNCGQTCVAPDYILCHRSVKDQFVQCVKAEIERQYGTDPLSCPDYGKIISKKHFERVAGLIDHAKAVHGGDLDREACRIAPTVMDNVTWDDAVMAEEIFGPIMPVLTFDDLDEAINVINAHDRPLALYLFAGNKTVIRRVTSECAYGGGCINDVIIHLATSNMGFGGVGESGMGSYHGKTGFDTFSHYKSIVDKKTWLDMPMRYRPYSELAKKLIRLFMK